MMIAPLLAQGEGDKMFTAEEVWFDPDNFQGVSQRLANQALQRDIYLQAALSNYLNVPTWGSAKPQPEVPPGEE